MLKVLRVVGESLAPEITEGDFVVLLKIPFSFNYIKPDDVIAFSNPHYGVMIKRVSQVDDKRSRFFVLGNNDLSVDSRRLGWIDHEDLVGKVIWHIKQR